MTSYSFSPGAQKDYESAILWYLGKSEKAAVGFVDAVDFALLQICRFPERYRYTYKQFREIGLKKFPFILIYTYDRDNMQIIIWKIFHIKRNPRKKFMGLAPKE